jgi:xylulose-5-phosphate/fructose-6-phosphate phosphoketolase
MTFEVVAAVTLLKQKVPELNVRTINVTDLMVLGTERSHPHSLTNDEFDSLFTEDKPVHFNYHGYPNELKGLLFGRPNMERVTIAAYMEEGSTTTPFNMMLMNQTSRFHVAIQAIKCAAKTNEKVKMRLHELTSELEGTIKRTQEYIMANKTGKSWQALGEELFANDSRRSSVPRRCWQLEAGYKFLI